jgi:hypothetical protein
LAARHQIPGARRHRHHPRGVSHLCLDALAFNHGHQLVGLGDVAGEGLFHQDVRPRIGRGPHHVHALIQPARANGNDVGLCFCDHVEVARVTAPGAATRHRFRAPALIGIGHGHDFRLGNLLPRHLPRMAIVASSGVANHYHTILPLRTIGRRHQAHRSAKHQCPPC